MTERKRLYFIPIIARALRSADPKGSMKKAFDEIRTLGKQEEYREGFQQFLEFIKTAVKPSEEESGEKTLELRNAIRQLIYDLATDTFNGDKEQEEALTNALRHVPDWDAEYERIKEEAQALLSPEEPLEIEILKDDQIIGSLPLSTDPTYISSLTPGRFAVQFSNGRLLWEGDLTKENLIWAFAFPEKNFDMAAETETSQRRPTRTLSLLDGELIIHVFAGLEAGQIRIESAKGI